jgi:hypothetical protein
MTRYEQARAALLSGELDDHLDLLLEDIRARQETLAAHDPPTPPEPTKPPQHAGDAIDVPVFGAGIDASIAESCTDCRDDNRFGNSANASTAMTATTTMVSTK